MKNLIYKELKLCLFPALFLFSLTAALLLIPNYPYCVGMMYGGIVIMICFSMGKANKDIEFTCILPVRRVDVVKAKHFTVMVFELLQMLVALPFALISSFIISPSGNIVGLDANFSLFAVTLLAYSAFNIIFLPLFFKTGYKVAWPAILASVGYVCIVILFECLIACIPALHAVFDGHTGGNLIYQIIFLLVAVLSYFGIMSISVWFSRRNFEKVNL